MIQLQDNHWGRRILNGDIEQRSHAVQLHVQGDDLELSDEITIFEGYDERVRGESYYYPALSVPTGGKERFSCPPVHIERAVRRLNDCSALLVVGFSGLDSHVLKLLPRLDQFKQIGFVHESHKAAQETVRRFAGDAASLLAEDVAINMGFGRFVGQGHLRRFLNVSLASV